MKHVKIKSKNYIHNQIYDQPTSHNLDQMYQSSFYEASINPNEIEKSSVILQSVL